MINYSKNLKNLTTEPVSTKFARNRAYDKFPWKLICPFLEFTTALVTRMNVRSCTDKQDLIYRYISNLQLHATEKYLEPCQTSMTELCSKNS